MSNCQTRNETYCTFCVLNPFDTLQYSPLLLIVFGHFTLSAPLILVNIVSFISRMCWHLPEAFYLTFVNLCLSTEPINNYQHQICMGSSKGSAPPPWLFKSGLLGSSVLPYVSKRLLQIMPQFSSKWPTNR